MAKIAKEHIRSWLNRSENFDDHFVGSLLENANEKDLLAKVKEFARMLLVQIDADTGKIQYRFDGVPSSVKLLSMSPDGKRFTAADGDTISTWNLESRQMESSFETKHKWSIASFAVRPDGKQIATVGSIDATLRVWNPSTGEKLYERKLPTDARRVCFTPDSRRLAVACDDRTVELWDTDSGQLLLTLADAQQPINSLSFSGDGQRLMAGCGNGNDSELIIWDGRPLKKGDSE